MSSFLRPIGVHRDIYELEYISALLQSNPHVVRTSGTIIAVDIAMYLKSRHGLIVPEEVIDRLILTELAGQIQDEPIKDPQEIKKKKWRHSKPDASEQQDVHLAMDMSQITAVLLIPELIEASERRDMKIFSPFRDVVTSHTNDDGIITGPILREIFASVNEYIVSDDVITEMLELADCPESLIDALVGDVTLYQEHANVSKAPKLVRKISDPKNTNNDLSITSIYTAPFIDTSADTFRRPSFGMQLWTTGIAAYFAYVSNDGKWITAQCNSDSIRCSIASGVAAWFSIFLQIVALGLPYILLGSLSNANYQKLYRFPTLLIGMITIFFVTVYTYLYSIETEAFDTSGNKDKYGTESCDGDIACIQACQQDPENCKEDYVVADDFLGSSFFLALFLGCTILLSQLVDLVLQLTPRVWLDRNGLVQRLVLPGTIRQERSGNQAASLRMQQFLTNALGVFNDSSILSSSKSDNTTKHVTSALERFLLLPVKTERVGGVFWVWKRIWDGTIFSQEGVWLNSRLLACNFSQIMIFGLLIFFTRVFYYKQNEFFYSEDELNYQTYIATQKQILFGGNYTQSFGEDYSDFFTCAQKYLALDSALLYTNGLFDHTKPWVFIPYLTTIFGSYDAAKDALKVCYDTYPSVASYLDNSFEVLGYQEDNIKNLVASLDITPSKYIAAAWCGLFGGFTAVTYIALILIPSFVSTVLKYRSGVKPTLTSPDFLRYRYAIDTTTVLLGSAFWGCFFTATGAFIFVVLLILFIGLLPLIAGAVIGFFIILFIQLSVLSMLRRAFFSAFFRRSPSAANLMFTVLEVWNIALTLGFVFIRAVKLVVVSILYIARIDTPFLAPGVGRFGSIELDSIAISFEKDLLIHEAHRHMLIERLGVLCLIKLHSSKVFATRAGSAWRLLFVLMNMPWLQKYRISRNAVDLDEMIAQLEDEMDEENDVFDRQAQMKKISELQSQKAVVTAEKGTVAEIKALRQRIAYLEDKNRTYEQQLNAIRLEKVDEEKTSITMQANEGSAVNPDLEQVPETQSNDVTVGV